jgi:homoprotocatechuate degradation regulator HpaR
MSTAPRRRPRDAAAHPAAFQHRNLPLLLLHARESVIAQFRPILNAHGFTEQQWRIVRALLETGPMEPRQIVQVCRISSPSLAGVLARMDEQGLVKRERMANDLRRVRVTLTAKSRARAETMAPLIEAAYREIERRLGAAEFEAFVAGLDRVIAGLGPGEVEPLE